MSLLGKKSPNGNGQNGNGPVEVRVSHVQNLEQKGVYRNPRPFTDDPTQQNMGLFHDPDNHRTMAHLSSGEAFDLALLETVGMFTRNPIHMTLAKNWALYSRSKNGYGADQMADVLRRTPHPEPAHRRFGGLFGRKKAEE